MLKKMLADFCEATPLCCNCSLLYVQLGLVVKVVSKAVSVDAVLFMLALRVIVAVDVELSELLQPCIAEHY